MAVAPVALTWYIARGESLLIPETIPIAPGADPRTDGSRFLLRLVTARDSGRPILTFDTSATPSGCTITNWSSPNVTLLFQASQLQILTLAAGQYLGDVIRIRPGGAFGPLRDRVAIVTLTVDGATTL